MKQADIFMIVFFLIIAGLTHSALAQFNYINPLPGSSFHHPETTLLFKAGSNLDPASIDAGQLVEITGSESGKHSWKPVLTEGRILIIQPDEAFAWGETVHVVLHPILRTHEGKQLEGLDFSFKISNEMSAEQKARYLASRSDEWPEGDHSYATNKLPEECSIDSLPGFQVLINNNPAPGQIFHNNQSDDKKDSNSFPTIINSDGSLIWACDLGISGHDFKVNYNGYVTYFDYPYNGWIVLDSNFATIDSIQCLNGYEMETNGHDIVMYPDGHTFIFAYNPQVIDMSQVVPGGQTDALVKGLVIQELNEDKQVIFQWRSWDHFLITDATDIDPLTGSIVDPVHGNSMELDMDGHLMLSSRNMSEITNINLETGEMNWRLGGENNQFTFINDNIPQNFSHQHDLRMLPNGNLTLFNNGVGLPVLVSSAKEYEMDYVNKTATLVWYYEHPPVGGKFVYGTGSGSVQRLENGNTLISWGKTTNKSANIPNYTEVDTEKNITWEFKFNEDIQRGYRVHRYVWQPCEVPGISGVSMDILTATEAKVNWSDVPNATAYDLQYRKTGNVNWKVKHITKSSKKLINLKPETAYEFRLRAYCQNGYVSDFTPADTFTTAPLRISSGSDVSCSFELYPNPGNGFLQLTFTAGMPMQADLTVCDLSGNQLLQRIILLVSGTTVESMDLSMLPSGIYLVQLNTGSQQLRRKFVKY